jgi:hypothetical protein
MALCRRGQSIIRRQKLFIFACTHCALYKCPQPRAVNKQRPMQTPAACQVAVAVAGLTGLGR